MPDVTVLLVSLAAAAIPTAFYVWLIYWVDRYEKEPIWLLSAAFLWGAVPSIMLAFFINSLLGVPVYYLADGTSFAETAVAIFVAPVVEESVKAIILVLIFLFWRNEIDSPLDGIIYGAMVGFGFAMVENVYYFLNEYQAGGFEAWGINVFLRSIIFGLNHALFTSLTGLGIAVARLSPAISVKIVAPILGWSTAIFLHFMHNLTVLQGGLLVCFTLLFDWGGVFLLFVIIFWALIQERSWLKKYLFEEIDQGTLTTRQFNRARSGRQRTVYKLDILFSHGFRANRQANRFFQMCSELAYAKHHYQLFPNAQNAGAIVELRQKIQLLGQKMI